MKQQIKIEVQSLEEGFIVNCLADNSTWFHKDEEDLKKNMNRYFDPMWYYDNSRRLQEHTQKILQFKPNLKVN